MRKSRNKHEIVVNRVARQQTATETPPLIPFVNAATSGTFLGTLLATYRGHSVPFYAASMGTNYGVASLVFFGEQEPRLAVMVTTLVTFRFEDDYIVYGI